MDLYVNQDILSYLDIDSLVIVKRIYSFWNIKPFSLSLHKKEVSISSFKYYELQSYQFGLIGSRRLVSNLRNHELDFALYGACHGRHLDLIKFLFSLGASQIKRGFLDACTGGDIECVKYLIEKGGCSWNRGLEIACQCGYTDIVDLMCLKGATRIIDGFRCACYGGQYDIVIKLVNENKLENSSDKQFILNSGLDNACECFPENITDKRIKLIYWLLEHNANPTCGLRCVSKLGNLQILRILLNAIGKPNPEIIPKINDSLSCVCIYNKNYHMIKELIEFGATNLNECLEISSEVAEPNVIELLVKSGATNLNECMLSACSLSKVENVKILLQNGANNFNEALVIACAEANIECVNLLLEHQIDDLNTALLFACSWISHIDNRCEIIKILLQRGANNIDACFPILLDTGNIECMKILIQKKIEALNKLIDTTNDDRLMEQYIHEYFEMLHNIGLCIKNYNCLTESLMIFLMQNLTISPKVNDTIFARILRKIIDIIKC